MYNFWGNLGALRMGFTQARAPTEKLPKVAHRRKEEQGGEELEPCPLSSWGLDMFLSTAGKCFILVQIQVSLSQSATNVRKLKGPVFTCSRGALCREVSMRQATQQPPHSRAVRVLNCSSMEPQHEGSEAPSFKRHHRAKWWHGLLVPPPAAGGGCWACR